MLAEFDSVWGDFSLPFICCLFLVKASLFFLLLSLLKQLLSFFTFQQLWLDAFWPVENLQHFQSEFHFKSLLLFNFYIFPILVSSCVGAVLSFKFEVGLFIHFISRSNRQILKQSLMTSKSQKPCTLLTFLPFDLLILHFNIFAYFKILCASKQNLLFFPTFPTVLRILCAIPPVIFSWFGKLHLWGFS